MTSCLASLLFAFAVSACPDASLVVQFDNVDRAELGCDELLRRAKLAGAEAVQLELCEFYLDGERRKKALETLSGEIAFFEKAGLPVALWITSLGYGPMTDPDFLRRFPDFRPLRSFEGKTAAVCSTDVRWRDAVAENVRDFIKAGAKTILFDDDLVQACRPGVCCTCDEHRRRIAARLGVADVTPEQMRDAYAGAPNPLRTACLDVMGESLMEFCRAMRAAADEVDPSVVLATCSSISQYDLDGVDVPEMVRLLAGKGAERPFVRLSGATYWVCHPGNSRNWGQGLGGVVEYLRWQAAMLRADGIVPLDENDPYPRDVGVVPEGLCEAYDRAVIAEGGIVRNKYVIRHNAKKKNGIDPEYLAAHLAGQEEAKRIAGLFRGASPIGFEVFAPPHLVRDATLPTPFAGTRALLKFFAQPMAGMLLSANGAPTRYDRDSGAPLAVFGPAAASLPREWMARGVLVDRDGAKILEGRGVDTGLGAKDGVTRVDGWNLYANAKGEKFAVAEKGWYDIDGREASPTPVPVREIWKFFTGKEIPACLEGARGVHLMAKRRPDGTLAILLNNMRGGAVGPFTLHAGDTSRSMSLPAYGFTALQAPDAKSRTVTVDTRVSAGRMNLRLNGGNGYTPIARLQSGGWKVFIKPMENLHLPIVRTHDTILMDDGVKTVDIHMIFANFRADENNPDNYWFKQTDEYLARAVKDGAKILFRLGESIEHGLVKYFVNPPEDFAKWARICSHIIDHYNNGWADGFHWNIEYWEIWNEPNAGPQCWTGTDEQFFDFYVTAAKYLKEKHPGIKVGGAGFTSDQRIYAPFLAAVAKAGAPLDFFSFHKYSDDYNLLVRDLPRQIRELVDGYGFTKAELVLDEWHYFPCGWKGLENNQPYHKKAYEQLATVEAGAFAAAVMIGWQDSPIDIGCYYTTGPDAVGWGLIERSKRELTDSYWCFKAYCDLMRYPDRVKAEAQEPLYVLAGHDGNGRFGVLVSGFRNGWGDITVHLDHAPKNLSLKAVDWNRQLSAAPFKVDDTTVTFQQQGNSAVFLLEFE